MWGEGCKNLKACYTLLKLGPRRKSIVGTMILKSAFLGGVARNYEDLPSLRM